MSYASTTPVFAPSRVTAPQFAAFLRRMGSPAAAEAAAIHDVLVSAGIDPAVALGQFAAESSFGKAGYAAITRNWGNIVISRPLLPHWTRAFGGTSWKASNGRTYARFGTWRNGARAYAALLRTYRARGWARSIEAMSRKWLGGIGTGYVANIVRVADQVAGVAVPAPKPPPPVVVPPPAPALPPIATTPEHATARQMELLPFGPPWSAEWVTTPSYRAWVASPGAPMRTYILVHGGPISAESTGGMDRLAGWLASRGARAVVVLYPTLDITWQAAIAPIKAALAAYPGSSIIAHSLGGLFGGIVAHQTGTPLVLVAAEDTILDDYRTALGNPPDPRGLATTTRLPVTVITGSADPVATVAEAQAVVDALHATGHPGRWVVIDGADHDSILSDVGAIAAVLAN